MPITRLNADVALLDRQGKLLVRVGKYSTATPPGGNGPFASPASPVPALTWPLTNTLLQLNRTPTTYGTVADADLATVPDVMVAQYLDYATLELLLAIRGWCDEVDEVEGLDSQKLSQTATLTDAQIKWWTDYIIQRYGIRPRSIRTGAMTVPPTPLPQGITWPQGYPYTPGMIPGNPPGTGGFFVP